ncbi:hypothetical protein MKZ15_05735 [Paenibacillus sp. FSL R7-0216]|uniref:hypothetical protein n=1 Tax=Paenibacillus sp. FSL R7-0216 TaxID=2921677 RepID=UPI0030D92100
MYVVLSDKDKERFYNINKIYLKFLGEDVMLAEHIKNANEYHSSTAADILKQLTIRACSKLSGIDQLAAKKLAPLIEEATNKDIKEKSTFDLLLFGLEEFYRKHLLLF